MQRKARLSRRGLSLTEVLISTFVMAVGLLSLASLIPVGLHEVAMANRAQNAAFVGRDAWREIKIRGWLRPRTTSGALLWYRARAPFDATNMNAAPFNRLVTSPYFNAFAIDPLFLSANSVTTYGNIEYFPYVSSGAPAANNRLPRITLRASEFDTVALAQSLGAYPVAERLFIANNDLAFDPINPVTGAKGDRPSRVYHNPSGTPLDAQPQFNGDYSWMLTVSPSPADPGRLFTASVVVFYKRSLQLPVLNAVEQRNRERVVSVSNFYGGGVGGGDIQISGWTAPEVPRIKAGQWLMLFTGDSSNANNPVRAAWYRIIAADDEPSDGATTRDLTILGPDWPFTTANATRAALFDTVVGVYEKTIQLE